MHARGRRFEFGDRRIVPVPSDHLIAKPKPFLQLLSRAARAAKDDALVVLGLEPRWAETGYGYIQRGAPDGAAYRIEKFVEKPSLERLYHHQLALAA